MPKDQDNGKVCSVQEVTKRELIKKKEFCCVFLDEYNCLPLENPIVFPKVGYHSSSIQFILLLFIQLSNYSIYQHLKCLIRLVNLSLFSSCKETLLFAYLCFVFIGFIQFLNLSKLGLVRTGGFSLSYTRPQYRFAQTSLLSLP